MLKTHAVRARRAKYFFVLLATLAFPRTLLAELSPLAEGLARLFIYETGKVQSDNPIGWQEKWWDKGAYTEEQVRSAFKELEEAFPDKIERLRRAGREYRRFYLEKQRETALQHRANYPKGKSADVTVKKAVLLLQETVRGSGETRLNPAEQRNFANQMTRFRVPIARTLPEAEWSQDYNVRSGFSRYARQAEDETTPKRQEGSLTEPAFEAWRSRLRAEVQADISDTLKAQFHFLNREFDMWISDVQPSRNPLRSPLVISEGTIAKLTFAFSSTGEVVALGPPDEKVKLGRGEGLVDYFRPMTIDTFSKAGIANYGVSPISPQFDGAFEHLETLNELNRENLRVLSLLDKIEYTPNTSLLIKRLSSLPQGFESNPDSLAERTSLRRPIPGPEGDLVKDLAWGRMAQIDPFTGNYDNAHFELRSEEMIEKPSFSEYLTQPKRPAPHWRANFKRAIRAGVVAGAVTGFHYRHEIADTDAYRTTIAKAKETISRVLEARERTRDWVFRHLPSWGGDEKDDANDGDRHTEAPEKREHTPENPIPLDKLERKPEEVPPIEKITDLHGISDSEKPEEAFNKFSPESVAEARNIVDFNIVDTKDLSNVPTHFTIGYLEDTKNQKSVPLLMPSRPDAISGWGSYSIQTDPNHFHIPVDGKVMLPRGDTNVPKKVDVWAQGEKLEAGYQVYLTERGQVFLQLDESHAKKPIQVKIGYHPLQDFSDKPLLPESLPPIDPGAMRRANDKLRAIGADVVADALDLLVEEAERNLEHVSVVDERFRGAFVLGTKYSYSNARTDTSFPPGDFRRLSPFVHEGVLCYQCDGAADTLKMYLEEVFRDSQPKVEIVRVKLIVREHGENKLTRAGYHAEIEVRLQGKRAKLVLDFTPPYQDPRNSRPPPLDLERSNDRETVEKLKTELEKQIPPHGEEDSDPDPEKNQFPEKPSVEEKGQEERSPEKAGPPRSHEPGDVGGLGSLTSSKPQHEIGGSPTPPHSELLSIWQKALNTMPLDDERRRWLQNLEQKKLAALFQVAQDPSLSQEEKRRRIQKILTPLVDREIERSILEALNNRPKPPPPPEKPAMPHALRELIFESRKLEEYVPSAMARQGQPIESAAKISWSAVKFLLSGDGLSPLITELEKATGTPVRIEKPEDLPAQFQAARKAIQKRIEGYETALGDRRSSPRFRSALNPSARGAIDAMLSQLERYPWKDTPEIDSAIAKHNSGESNVACENAMSDLSGRYLIPQWTFTAPPRLGTRRTQ